MSIMFSTKLSENAELIGIFPEVMNRRWLFNNSPAVGPKLHQHLEPLKMPPSSMMRTLPRGNNNSLIGQGNASALSM